MEDGANKRTERVMKVEDGEIHQHTDGRLNIKTNLHAPVLRMKFLREVDRLAKQGVKRGEEENLVLAVYWDANHQKESVLIRNMALHETLVDALAYDVVFINLRDLVDRCPILTWGEGPKMYETFMGRHNFKLPRSRAQTAAERTNTFKHIVETITISEGTKTTFKLYKLVKDVGIGTHLFSAEGTAFMHMASMGGSEDIVEEQRRIKSKAVRQADHQGMDMSVYTRFGPALATFLRTPIVRMAVFEVIPCSVKEHMVSAWHVAFNRTHLNMLLHDRN